MSKKPKISIVILTYNSNKDIKNCLKSVKKELKKVDGEIIVVDNSSTDNTGKVVRNFSATKFIENKKNLGFSGGVNIGIKSAKGDKILLLNPDTTLKKGAIKNIIHCADQQKAGIVGGKLFRENGSVQRSFVRKPNFFTIMFDFTNLRKLTPFDFLHKKHYYLDQIRPKKAKIVDAVSGAFMMIDSSVIKKVGLFDQKFFMYLEDVDFCLRAQAKGFKIMYCPSSQAVHIGGASSQNEDRINYQAWFDSRRYYTHKHFGFLSNLILQATMLADEIVTKLWIHFKNQKNT